jgi:hydrogenase expression/formation protein HypC
MCLAVPGRVASIHDDHGIRMARIDFGGVLREVCLACLPDIAVGDYALVHVGFAIAVVDEAAAEATLGLLSEQGLFDEGPARPPDAAGGPAA